MVSIMDRRRSAQAIGSGVVGIAAGALIMSAAMGIRQTFGIFIGPLSHAGFPMIEIALAIALQNLVWGFAQPFAGAIADRCGPAFVVAIGALAYALGMVLTALASSGLYLMLGTGVFVGIGISCTAFGVVLPAIGRIVASERRNMAMGLVSAGSSLGQVVLVPLAQGISDRWGLMASLLALAGVAAAAAPFGLLLHRPGDRAIPQEAGHSLPLRAAVVHALRNPGYRLLTIGFFTCGFQLAFIGTHLPNYLLLCHLPVGLGATALSLIGLFNIAGCWGCGWLGGRFRQQYVLGWLYVIRGAAIAAFLLLPKTSIAVIVFSAVMGLTWLGTVPLTGGLVLKVFGARHLGTLFGVCFLSHQIGSFFGAWLGGYLFELTGSYSLVWGATAVAGGITAALHFAIRDEHIPPAAAAASAAA